MSKQPSGSGEPLLEVRHRAQSNLPSYRWLLAEPANTRNRVVGSKTNLGSLLATVPETGLEEPPKVQPVQHVKEAISPLYFV